MKRMLLAFGVLLLALPSFSQLLSWTPNFPQESTTPFTITVDATKGNQGLMGYTPTSDVYVHIGVITNLSTGATPWKYVKFNQNFNVANPSLQAVSLGSNRWSFTITGGLRTYFGIVNAGETIQKIAILFRNGAGTKVQRNENSSDMYIPVYTTALATRFTLPFKQPTYLPIPENIVKAIGNTIPMTAVANNTSDMKLFFNGTQVQSVIDATTVSASPTILTAGTQTLIAEATDGITTKRDTIEFFVPGAVNIAALPAGLKPGINYEANTTAATLVLYAPSKTRVSVIGDLPGSNWAEKTTYQFNRSPDGNYWWLRITGLTPGTEYSYQYLVDGTLKIADPYAEKILDPWNDQYISATTYPGLKAYPTGITSGVVSLLQTAAPAYTWKNNTFNRPDKRGLVVYELLLRDFLAAHDWNTLRDTLNYLKKLGINAIELMPVNEFEGNESWGYNPDFYFAPDKYYGPANTMKRFVDSCHSKGIAVVMDIALNHSFGLSPMVQLYWDAANNRPAANNPWFNPVQKHPFNVGYDMNHESAATKYYFSRIVEHWLVNYKIDGFRFDLSKGFTQNATCDANGANCDVNGWSAKDNSRIAIWKGYYDTLQLKAPGSYVILEHFADNSEEIELANYGMMLWGNLNYNYNEATMGFSPNWNFDYGVYTARGWSNPHLITYMESHDEERLMYKNLQFGNVSGAYNIKTLPTALKRMELAGAFFFTIPGPKMVWQFGELGYEYSINYCPNGTINNNCRTDSKPIRWDYKSVTDRDNLYHAWAAMINLRHSPQFSTLFNSANNITRDFSGAFKWMKVTQGASNIMVIGNFDVVAQTGSVTFPTAGTWYNYLTGATFASTGGSQSFTLQPGEYRIYLNQFVVVPVTITSFNGKGNVDHNLLQWVVENEQGLSYYELERSTDGQTFSSVTKVTATGNRNYSFADFISKPSAPVYYYRLKCVDRDGSFKYSAIVRISNGVKGFYAVAGPNPFTDRLTLSIESAVNDEAQVRITDMSGRPLVKFSRAVPVGSNVFDIREVSSLSAGTYLLQVTTAQQQQTIKIIKGK